MNVEIGAEAALFPEKEYISGIFAVQIHPVKKVMLKWFFMEIIFCTFFVGVWLSNHTWYVK